MKYGKVTTELKNLPHDEPVFVLRAKDILAPVAIENYANLLRAAAEGSSDFDRQVDLRRMAKDVSSVAASMIAWQAENRMLVRLPD